MWKIGVSRQSSDRNECLCEQVHFCVLGFIFGNEVIDCVELLSGIQMVSEMFWGFIYVDYMWLFKWFSMLETG